MQNVPQCCHAVAPQLESNVCTAQKSTFDVGAAKRPGLHQPGRGGLVLGSSFFPVRSRFYRNRFLQTAHSAIFCVRLAPRALHKRKALTSARPSAPATVARSSSALRGRDGGPPPRGPSAPSDDTLPGRAGPALLGRASGDCDRTRGADLPDDPFKRPSILPPCFFLHRTLRSLFSKHLLTIEREG